MNKTITKILFPLAFSVFVCLAIFSIFPINLSATPKALAETSHDAIAIRVIKNEDFLSIDRWYQNQGFKGSPQKLKVDGYDAIRDGRTVYVGASNVTGICYLNGVNTGKSCNNNLDCLNSESCNLSSFYTNVYLISYNQSPEQATVDIFGQIISHWKFNANLNSPDKCSQSDKIKCLIDSECPDGEYCTSFKASIVRDVLRLADVNEIKFALEDYKQRKGYYPKLESGSYLPGSSLSVWPSWQETLAKELGLTLPSDPINIIGACSDKRFNSDTCWDDNKKEFDGIIKIDEIKTKLNQEKLYGYYNDNGHAFNLCANLETTFSNTGTFKCDSAVVTNRDPIITSVNLTGSPKEEFRGYVEAYDPDNDPISFSVELIPMADGKPWTDNKYKWEWDNASSKFTIKNTIVNNQRMIHATKAGNASVPDLYKIRITVKDNQSGVAIVESDINIKAVEIKIFSDDSSMIIGQNKIPAATLTGTDSSGNPLTNLTFINAVLPDGSTATAIPAGFSLNGMNLNVNYDVAQKTGVYTINVETEDATTHKKANSFFKISITNRPPEIKSFRATYVNGQSENCVLLNNCEFTIDNGEDASVQVAATDPDLGHKVNYSLADTFGGKLSIDNTGKITGFKDLNFELGNADSFNIQVKVRDDYCANSTNQSECSSSDVFKIIVEPFCSISRNMFTLPGAYTGIIELEKDVAINDIMSRIQFPIPNKCSQIGNAKSKVTVGGVVQGLDIIFVVDTSGSMNGQENMDNCSSYCSAWQNYKCCYDPTMPILFPQCKVCPPNGSKPIDQTIDALNTSINSIRTKIDQLPAIITANVGLITYDNVVNDSEIVPLASIRDDIHKNKLLSTVTSLTASGGTNILDALNRAETMMAGSTSKNKIIILLSDGIPEVTKKWAGCHQYNEACTGSYNWCKCKTCDYCGGGGGGGGGGGSSYNTNADFKVAIVDVDQTHCNSESCTGVSCTPSNPDCTDSSCYYYLDYHCDLSNSGYPDNIDYVNKQANILKNLKNEIYTIFFKTGIVDNSNKMCLWSSDPSCPTGGTYAYEASVANIDDIFKAIIDRIFQKPKDIFINTINPGWVLDDTKITETFDWNGINNFLSCSANLPIKATYNNDGSLVISDIQYEYCPLLKHQ